MIKPKIIEVDGLRVVLVKQDRLSVLVRMFVGAGSREETDENAGVAHFLEHYVFNGTKQYPGLMDVKEAIEKVGGAMNAYTSKAEMGFWAKMDKGNLPLAMRIVAQIVGEPTLPVEHFAKERGTIIEELKMYDDNPNYKSWLELTPLLYGSNGLGRETIGTIGSLKNMKVMDLKAYMDKWFLKKNMILGIVGDYGSEERVKELVRKEFAKILENETSLPKRDEFSWKKQDERQVRLIKREIMQANVAMGWRGIELTNKLRWASYLANIVFGDGWTSRLWKEIREERGLAYNVGSDVDMFVDAGSVGVGAGVPKDKMQEAVELIWEIAYGLRSGKWMITKEDLETAKGTYRGRVSLSYDQSDKVLGMALSDLNFEGKVYTPEEILALADKVTLDDIQEFCELVFRPEHMNLVVVGNYDKLPW